MFDRNWAAVSHDDIAAELAGGAGTGFGETGGSWGDLAQRLVDVADAVQRATGRIPEARSGAAADAAQQATAPMSPWAQDARSLAGGVGSRSAEQSGDLAHVVRSMPTPHPAGRPSLQWNDVFTAFTPEGVGTIAGRMFAQHDANVAAEQQAQRLMISYQDMSSRRAGTLPQFVNPDQRTTPGPDDGTGGGGAGDGGRAGGGLLPPSDGPPPASVPTPSATLPPPSSATPPSATPPSATPPSASPGPSGPSAPSGPGLVPNPPRASPTGPGLVPGAPPRADGPPGSADPGRRRGPATGGGAPAQVPERVPGGGAPRRTPSPRVPSPSEPFPGDRSTRVADPLAPGSVLGGDSPGGPRPGELGPGELGPGELGPGELGPGGRAGAGGPILESAVGRGGAGVSEAGRGGGGEVPLIPPGVGGMGGRDDQHRRPDWLAEDDPDAIAGQLPRVAPPVIGE